MIIILLQFIMILFISLAAILIVTFTLINGISPMPTSAKVLKQLPKLTANISPTTIADLGAGWGTLAFELAKLYPNAKVVAYENSPVPFLYMKCRKFFSNQNNIEIVRQNVYASNLSQFDFIVCYLHPKAMQVLQKQFEEQLHPACYVLSHTFALPTWTPIKVEQVKDLYETKIYLYKMPQAHTTE